MSARGGKAGKSHNRRAGPRPQPHQMPMNSPYVNPFIQARHPLTQGFLCDWCVVSVEDGQAAVRDSMDQVCCQNIDTSYRDLSLKTIVYNNNMMMYIVS